jgi:hypothetical protein
VEIEVDCIYYAKLVEGDVIEGKREALIVNDAGASDFWKRQNMGWGRLENRRMFSSKPQELESVPDFVLAFCGDSWQDVRSGG